MITREPNFYPDFHCLGGACPMTCCRDWEIVLDEDAIADYRNAPGPLKDLIAANLITDEEGDVCFRLREDGVCTLLDGDGLCPIQRHWGEEHLCVHCGAYPRFNEEYGCLTENAVAISCPEAARLVMERGLFPLRVTDDGVDDAPFDGVDGELLRGLITSRERAFALLCNQESALTARLGALLFYADDLQDCVDFGLPLENCALPSHTQLGNPAALRDLTVRLLRRLASLEPLRQSWPKLLLRRAQALEALTDSAYLDLWQRFLAACPAQEAHLERLAAYFLFRHWPKVVNDDLLYGRAALSVCACLVLGHLAMLEWLERGTLSPADEALLWAAFSREIEHLDENFDTLVEEFYDQEQWPLARALTE